MIQLVVEKGSNKGFIYPLDKEGYVIIGRSSSNPISLDDEGVSRQHCRIRLKKGKIHIQDLKSRNGTFVNYRSLEKPTELNVGDVIQLGETEILLSNQEVDGIIGKQIHNYIFQQRLGRGGGGTVYLGRQTNLDREVAIKVLDPKLALQEKYRQNFIKEARSAAKLNHHRIIGVYDIVEQDDHVFFSMEYMSHGSLGEMATEQKKLPVDMVHEYIIQATEGLIYLHEGNILHRDIKPANLMLDKEGDLKLGDFGTAVAESEVTEGNVMGTPSFMSPEHISGLPIDGRSDLYSLGCTAFRLMAGMPPFFGRSVKEILAAHVNDEPPSFKVSVPEMSEELADIFDRLLKKDPNERFDNATSFLEDLKGVGSIASRTKKSKKKRRKKRRSASTSRGRRSSPNRIIRKKRSKDE